MCQETCLFKHQQSIVDELKQDLKKITEIDDVDVEKKLNDLFEWLQISPKITTFRVNTLLTDADKILTMLLNLKNINKSLSSISIESKLPELIIIEAKKCHQEKEMINHDNEAVVDAACGAAVLRGSHVFAPGIMGLTGGNINDKINLYADITGLSKKGFIKKYDNDSKKYLGYGILRQTRNEIFHEGNCGTGLAIEMIETISGLPQLNETDLPDGFVLLQNFPSIICSRIVDPQPDDIVLDMCAAPGNKTTHLSALMKNKGKIIAMEKIKSKISKMKNNCQKFGCKNVDIFCFDATKSVNNQITNENNNSLLEPPFFKQTFDKILLDGPCSVLGKRPQLFNKITCKELRAIVPLQKKLFTSAVELLKDGGTLVYSTCTITIAENEEIVAWALKNFPCLKLNPARQQYDSFNLEKYPVSSGYPIEDLPSNLADNLLRFGSENNTVGFFIASFKKNT
ncbi:hypothetical protein HCN44_007398 [Aphidius gifuensis]|uniref:SAM-dependent MTase RsmB/NOP-type domain-containing protein n=1 Tax=Aphidius gifuensis TaxID=684658 RepID=A0A835CPE6_APHGI|nr:tRNA (cytosine(72)-C(5))-methyltransferase NSUN6 [Aphidius gifuensis]KAF7989088.1 hypothetical protein HCN44_007398 [Aphidius gifuensis]